MALEQLKTESSKVRDSVGIGRDEGFTYFCFRARVRTLTGAFLEAARDPSGLLI